MTIREALLTVGGHMETLSIPYAFLGASVLPFLVDYPEILDIRPTVDIDLTIEIGSLSAFYRLEETLRQKGFRNDTREGAPICRWIIEGVTVDIMPTEGRLLGIGSEWFREAVQHSERRELAPGRTFPLLTAPYFLVTKLTAFRDRGAADPYLSKDLEDVVTLLNGCESLPALMALASTPLRSFVKNTLSEYQKNPQFEDAITGFFRTDPVSRARCEIVLDRLRSLAAD